MTDPATIAARLVAAGLDADTAEQVAIELMPADELRTFALSMFAKPADTADTTTPPTAPNIVPAEGSNPSLRGRTGDDVRQFTRGLFGITD